MSGLLVVGQLGPYHTGLCVGVQNFGPVQLRLFGYYRVTYGFFYLQVTYVHYRDLYCAGLISRVTKGVLIYYLPTSVEVILIMTIKVGRGRSIRLFRGGYPSGLYRDVVAGYCLVDYLPKLFYGLFLYVDGVQLVSERRVNGICVSGFVSKCVWYFRDDLGPICSDLYLGHLLVGRVHFFRLPIFVCFLGATGG